MNFQFKNFKIFNKIVLVIVLLFSIFILSGCGMKQEEAKKENPDDIKIPNPISDPGGYVPDMVGAKKNMERKINESVAKENDKLEKSLKENQ